MLPADDSKPKPKPATRKHPGGPIKLNKRMLRMIELMVSGHPDDPGHVRFGLYDAAAAVGYHRRAARALAQSPVFLEAYHSALAGDDIAHLCPTLEQVRAMMAKQNAARHLVQHKAGCIVRAPAKEGVAADGAA